MARRCWLARFDPDPCDTSPRGELDDMHLIPQRRIKRTLKARGYTDEQLERILRDPRIRREGCRLHHDRLDRKFIRLRAEDYPASTHDFAQEHGFTYDEERCEWIGLAAPERKAA